MKIQMKDLAMLGIIGGIACFFIGAIISTVFPSSQTDLLSYKVSGAIKLVGIGVLTSSMIIGGITIEDIDKNVRLLLLVLGLVLLTIYTVGSQSLQWYVPTTSQTPSGNQSYENRPTGYGVPGFELSSLIGALVIVLFIIKKKYFR
jgi:membrane protease YdiL (CAAX protease family)